LCECELEVARDGVEFHYFVMTVMNFRIQPFFYALLREDSIEKFALQGVF